MAIQLKGQSTWDAKAQAAREARTRELYEQHKLRPEDEVRFPKPGKTQAWLYGHPVSVAADGSLNVSVAGRIRSIVPGKIQVKMRGPRGGITWEDLLPEEEP
jgi:hypothetical protein